MELLHVGCGGEALPPWLFCTKETRLDIDPNCHPDIVASMVDMGDIGPFDAVFSCHSLEHLPFHDVALALGEFWRVLRPGGCVVVFVPDLEGVSPDDEVLYTSPAGPITGFDLIYGHRPQVQGNSYMAHRSGFTRHTLAIALGKVGFSDVNMTRASYCNLIGTARKP